jgi:hypothetical protein
VTAAWVILIVREFVGDGWGDGRVVALRFATSWVRMVSLFG